MKLPLYLGLTALAVGGAYLLFFRPKVAAASTFTSTSKSLPSDAPRHIYDLLPLGGTKLPTEPGLVELEAKERGVAEPSYRMTVHFNGQVDADGTAHGTVVSTASKFAPPRPGTLTTFKAVNVLPLDSVPSPTH